MANVTDRNQTIVLALNSPSHIQEKKSNASYHDDVQDDDILAMKIQCVNNAIDEIGFTIYQLKLFFLNGFGYAVDSLLILLNALTQAQVTRQYQPYISKAQTIAIDIDLLSGALF
jgi:hypothetical protein